MGVERAVGGTKWRAVVESPASGRPVKEEDGRVDSLGRRFHQAREKDLPPEEHRHRYRLTRSRTG